MGSCFKPPHNQQLQAVKRNSKKQFASLTTFSCVHLPQSNLRNHEILTVNLYQLFSLFTVKQFDYEIFHCKT